MKMTRLIFFLLFSLMISVGCAQAKGSPPETVDIPPAPPASTQSPAATCHIQIFNAEIHCLGCNAPDPTVQIVVGTKEVYRTRTQRQTFSPTWHQVSAALSRKDLLSAKIVMMDSGKHKLIAEWYVDQTWILTDPNAGHMVGSQYADRSVRLNLAVRCADEPPT